VAVLRRNSIFYTANLYRAYATVRHKREFSYCKVSVASRWRHSAHCNLNCPWDHYRSADHQGKRAFELV
jgi:hypothetical protein